MRQKILLVEDDVNLAFVVKDTLATRDYDVIHAPDGQAALRAVSGGSYDIILMDVMLPGMDGFTISQQLRRQRDLTPILFLTARGQQEDRIRGFESGGDDYLTKPFSIEELTLRIKAILRRTQREDELPLSFPLGSYSFDYDTFTLSHIMGNVTMTRREADLLVFFYQHCNKTVTREQLLVALWGENDYFKGRSMDVFITRLRKYFQHDDSVRITNIHGVGFRLETS